MWNGNKKTNYFLCGKQNMRLRFYYTIHKKLALLFAEAINNSRVLVSNLPRVFEEYMIYLFNTEKIGAIKMIKICYYLKLFVYRSFIVIMRVFFVFFN